MREDCECAVPETNRAWCNDYYVVQGFTDGVLIVGPYAGRKVSEAKPLIKEELLSEKLALLYSEPERVVRRLCDPALTQLFWNKNSWLTYYYIPDLLLLEDVLLHRVACICLGNIWCR